VNSFELTTDATTRKIRAGSDLRHVVWYRRQTDTHFVQQPNARWGSLRLTPINYAICSTACTTITGLMHECSYVWVLRSMYVVALRSMWWPLEVNGTYSWLMSWKLDSLIYQETWPPPNLFCLISQVNETELLTMLHLVAFVLWLENVRAQLMCSVVCPLWQ